MKKILFNIFTIFTLVLASSCVQNTSSDSSKQIKAKLPFKAFLKSKKMSVEIDAQNEFETFQRENKYANHYFGLATIFPKDWQIDRGASEYTLLRAYDEQKSSTVSLIAVPFEIKDSLKAEENQRKYIESPLRLMNSTANGNYEKKLFDEISSSTNTKILKFKIGEEWIATTNYLKYEYEFENKFQGNSYAFKTIGYQVIKWGVTYTFIYTSPVKYFNENFISKSLQNTNYIKVD